MDSMTPRRDEAPVTYLIKKRRGRSPFTATGIHVRHPDKLRAKGRPIGGMFQEVESIGPNKEWLRVSTERGKARDARGSEGYSTEAQFLAEAKEAKKHIRTLRPQEAAELAAIDERLEEAKQVVKAIRDEREETARRAFQRGHVVRLSALLEMAERPPR